MTHTNNDSGIPLHRWVMHGSVMLGRALCYAMETALVTPVLLQIGLPEQYYSLTWFPSSALGLIVTPMIGSLSDSCTLRLGRRRPFILALCVGVLLGLALFLNGSLIGLLVGDTPGSQPIGIILTVLGVVVLDFCADATDGPIRSYLLDNASTPQEKDMALNIHTFAGGIGGVVGYMLAGLDWTDTALGRAFKNQEQILFLFTAIIFIVTVILHMFSIPEQPLKESHQAKAMANGDPCDQSSLKPNDPGPTGEEDSFAHEENPVDLVLEMDVPDVECVMSNSDSALDIPDTAKQLDLDLDLNANNLLPEARCLPAESQHEMEEAFSSTSHVNYASSPTLSPPVPPPPTPTGEVVELQPSILLTPPQMDGQTDDHSDSTDTLALLEQRKAVNGVKDGVPTSGHSHTGGDHGSTEQGNPLFSTSTSFLSHPQMDNQQHSFILPVSGRVISQVYHLRKPVSTVTVRLLWLSMLKMPSQLWRLCVCHLITWFSVLALSLFYTDFMGQVIYHGDPTAPANSIELQNYHKGVQMGCWGLTVYSASAAASSALLLDRFHLSIKAVYMLGTLGFSMGTALMAIFPNVYIAMVMVSSMGVMDMMLSFCPFALLGQYHEIKEFIQHSPENSRRGFGVDCAILSCQVYISQILVASALSAVVDAVGSVRVIPVVASVASFLGFLTACFLVIYPNSQRSSELVCKPASGVIRGGSGSGVEKPSLEHEGFPNGSQLDSRLPQS